MRQNRTDINGIVLVNKPQNYTSFDAVAIVRRVAQTGKVGHSGTLDPMATGVLPIFVGRAVKAVDLVPATDKAYTAGFKLGYTSDTEDIWGNVTKISDKNISLSALTEAVNAMQGEISQIPPMYSAVKVGGQKLYSLARQGIEVERPARKITVYKITVDSYDENTREGVISVHCSKGTYIRTLVSDIGKLLGTGAVMSSLIRTLACGFDVSRCIDIEAVKQMTAEDLKRVIIPLEELFTGFTELKLTDTCTRLFTNGAVLDMGRMGISYPEGTVFRMTSGGEFLGLGQADKDNGIKVKLLYKL